MSYLTVLDKELLKSLVCIQPKKIEGEPATPIRYNCWDCSGGCDGSCFNMCEAGCSNNCSGHCENSYAFGAHYPGGR
jgi:hypothetical protein